MKEKKLTKLKKKNRNRFKSTGFDSVFWIKTNSTWFVLIFFVWLGFSLIWLGFFRFDSVFFWFQTYKTEIEPVGFFKILISLIVCFSRFSFFNYIFSDLIGFLVFLFTPNIQWANIIFKILLVDIHKKSKNIRREAWSYCFLIFIIFLVKFKFYLFISSLKFLIYLVVCFLKILI